MQDYGGDSSKLHLATDLSLCLAKKKTDLSLKFVSDIFQVSLSLVRLMLVMDRDLNLGKRYGGRGATSLSIATLQVIMLLSLIFVVSNPIPFSFVGIFFRP